MPGNHRLTVCDNPSGDYVDLLPEFGSKPCFLVNIDFKPLIHIDIVSFLNAVSKSQMVSHFF